MPSMIRRNLLLTAAAASAFAWHGTARAFSPPEGAVVLTVAGVPDEAEPVYFDRTLLEDLPAVTIQTTTIWTDGPQEFTGVELSVLLEHLGVVEGRLSAVAVNDYAVEIPVSDAVTGGPIVAYLQNGAPMSLRDRGPLWIVYPYDHNPDYRSEVIYARSIWQLDRLFVLPN
ncbi:MAG: molybdopterin-dependent oxidoreductase [Pseudomonadota bacterium]